MTHKNHLLILLLVLILVITGVFLYNDLKFKGGLQDLQSPIVQDNGADTSEAHARTNNELLMIADEKALWENKESSRIERQYLCGRVLGSRYLHCQKI
ncbi:MAG: hypothetical protein ACE5HO_10255 [bacterium]